MRLKTSVSRTITRVWRHALAVVLGDTRGPVLRFVQKPGRRRTDRPACGTTCGWGNAWFRLSAARFAPKPLLVFRFGSASYVELVHQGGSPTPARQTKKHRKRNRAMASRRVLILIQSSSAAP